MAINEAWLDKILEASDEELTSIIDKAIDNNNGMGIEDVNAAGTELLSGGASTDPFALTYDKTNSYSQTIDMGDENITGTVSNDPTDDALTHTTITSGSETKAVEELANMLYEQVEFSPEDLRAIYNECVADVIRESKKEIDARFNQKTAKAKKWKAMKIAKEKIAAKKLAKGKAVKESADINSVLDNLFGLA